MCSHHGFVELIRFCVSQGWVFVDRLHDSDYPGLCVVRFCNSDLHSGFM